jgi:hypothetical protein
MNNNRQRHVQQLHLSQPNGRHNKEQLNEHGAKGQNSADLQLIEPRIMTRINAIQYPWTTQRTNTDGIGCKYQGCGGIWRGMLLTLTGCLISSRLKPAE